MRICTRSLPKKGALLAVAGLALLAHPGLAAVLTWSPAGAGGGGGSGTWDAAGTNWWNGASLVAFGNGDQAVLAGSGGTISVSSPNLPNGNSSSPGLTISADGYTLTGGTLAFGSGNAAALSIASGATVTFDCDMTTPGINMGLSRTGTGMATVNLNGGVNLNSVSSNFSINADVLARIGTTFSLAGGRFNFAGGAVAATIANQTLTVPNGVNLSGTTTLAGTNNLTVASAAATTLAAANRLVTAVDGATLTLDFDITGGAAANQFGTGGTNLGLVIIEGANDYLAYTYLAGGTWRALGTALPANGGVRLLGGGLETNGTFTRTLTTSTAPGAGLITIGNGALGSGWGARDGSLTIDLNTPGVRDTLTWSSGGFFIAASNVNLLLATPTANHVADFFDHIDLGTTNRTVIAYRNPDSTAGLGRISGNLSGTGAGLVKEGAGLLELTGANSYTGITNINTGTLRAEWGVGIPNVSFIRFNGAQGVWASSGTQTVPIQASAGGVFWTNATMGGGFAAIGGAFDLTLEAGGATLAWDNANTGFNGATLMLNSFHTTDRVTIINDINLNGADRTVVVDDNPFLNTDRARLAGALKDGTVGGSSLIKTGAGTLELAGANTYTGTTAVSAGTLLILGATSGQGNYIVGAGGVLGGNGTIGLAPGNSVTIAGSSLADALLAPGTSIGTLHVAGDVRFGDYGGLLIELDPASSALLAVDGGLDLASAGMLDRLYVSGTLGSIPAYTLVTYTGTRTGLFDEVYFNGSLVMDPELGGIGSYRLAYGDASNGDIQLLFTTSETVVPEPTSLALLALATVLMQRRRQSC